MLVPKSGASGSWQGLSEFGLTNMNVPHAGQIVVLEELHRVRNVCFVAVKGQGFRIGRINVWLDVIFPSRRFVLDWIGMVQTGELQATLQEHFNFPS
jgi:hypothetical protein